SLACHQRNANHRGQSEGQDGDRSSHAVRSDSAQAGPGTERSDVPVLKRKLWLLNFALVALVAAGVWQLRKEKQEFRARVNRTLGNKPPLQKPPAPLPSTPPPAVTASSYLDIAQKMLWSHDRNSQVILDPPKPPAPPKPLPTLPSVFGVMNIGDGPIVMMSDKPGARQRGVHPGEKIGEFKLVSV